MATESISIDDYESSVSDPFGTADRLLIAVLRIAGLFMLFAATAKILVWPDTASFELLPIFCIPAIWMLLAVMEMTVGIWMTLTGNRSTTLILAVLAASLFLVVNAFLYFSNQRECVCFGNMRFDTITMAGSEAFVIVVASLLVYRNAVDLGLRKLLLLIVLGIGLGSLVLIAGRSDQVFQAFGAIDALSGSRGRLGNTALVAEKTVAGSASTVDVLIVAGDQPVTVIGYAVLGARTSDKLPLHIPAHTEAKVTIHYRSVRRVGRYLLAGTIYTNQDHPESTRFFLAGETTDRTSVAQR
jgi:hypothetical protein